MIDLIYVIITAAFFALMLVYVHACDRLGHSASTESGADGTRSEGKHP